MNTNLKIYLLALGISGCWPFPKKIRIEDPKLAPLILAAQEFKRHEYGFSELPDTGSISMESQSNEKYDVMLHFSRTKVNGARTIAFAKKEGKYQWIGEQEIFYGPTEYQTVDGIQREQICLTFDKMKISGAPIDSLYITYRGENPEFESANPISKEKAIEWKRRWGYK